MEEADRRGGRGQAGEVVLVDGEVAIQSAARSARGVAAASGGRRARERRGEESTGAGAWSPRSDLDRGSGGGESEWGRECVEWGDTLGQGGVGG